MSQGCTEGRARAASPGTVPCRWLLSTSILVQGCLCTPSEVKEMEQGCTSRGFTERPQGFSLPSHTPSSHFSQHWQSHTQHIETSTDQQHCRVCIDWALLHLIHNKSSALRTLPPRPTVRITHLRLLLPDPLGQVPLPSCFHPVGHHQLPPKSQKLLPSVSTI